MAVMLPFMYTVYNKNSNAQSKYIIYKQYVIHKKYLQ